MTLDFNDQVVIISGAGNGLGKAYATFFASRGASVLVNDFSKEAADGVVAEIKSKGGKALANYDSVTDGGKIVEQALKEWGKVHILINNAGILRDKSFKGMDDKAWSAVQEVHIKGAFACTKACWPVMRKQKFGRIINTSSAAGIYGNFGQANYSSAKLGLIGFMKTIAKEGVKYNITCNAVAPVAASAMTATIMPPEVLAKVSPDMIVALVAYLVHSSTSVSGDLFEAGAGWYGKLRWERSKGVMFKADESFTPGAAKERWDQVLDFSEPSYPQSVGDANYEEKLAAAQKLSTNVASSQIFFKDQTALITGAGAGLGRSYALMYAKGGANVVVNDMNAERANAVVREIRAFGGNAIAAVGSTIEGEKLVKAALEAFGSLHIVVCNAGVLRDKAFVSVSESDWDLVYNTHVKGTFAVTHAAWPIFQKQKYGRVLTTASAVGLYGNFGQSSYTTAKAAILGLTKTLAIEGKKYNILANCIAPNAGTDMTRTIWPEETVKAFSPDFVAPVVGYLTSNASNQTLGLFEVSGGWVAAVRWQRTFGYAFPIDQKVTPEDVKNKWEEITRFDAKATYPTSTKDAHESIFANFTNVQPAAPRSWADSEDPAFVVEAKKSSLTGTYSFTERDVALYNLGIGAGAKDLPYVFELDQNFHAIPTFGVTAGFATSSGLPLGWLPNFHPTKLLHAEQYLKILAPIPNSGTFTSTSRLAEVLDKGKAAAVTIFTTTVDQTGTAIFEDHSTVFIRGAGGFGGKKTGIDRGAATAVNKPPSRAPDAVVEEKTSSDAAAIYRLSGDYNPLHIDPEFAKKGNFPAPILHGLCFFGFSGKHIVEKFGPIQDIKTRFVGSLYPGETIITSMWKEGNKIIFVTKCKERDIVILAAAAATLA